MKKQKNFRLLIFIAAAWCVFGGVRSALAATEISSDINVPATWRKENSPYIVLGYIYVNVPLVIEPGVVVKFKNLSGASLEIRNSFSAIGTPSEPVVFTSTCDYKYGGETKSYCSYRSPLKGDWGSLKIYQENTNPVSIEYAKIFYASSGIYHGVTVMSGTFKNLSVKHSEIRYCSSRGIFLRYTQPTLDGLILANNYNGIEIYDANSEHMAKIRNSAIFNNSNAGIQGFAAGRLFIPFDARYNWWGDSSGPYYNYDGAMEASNLNGKGNRITGKNVFFRPWGQTDPTIPKEPVILVPGIGASINPDLMISGVLADNWTMFDHTYDGIMAAFKAMGYVEGKNFFIVYYDWRKSNAESAESYLKPVIKEALTKSGAEKVNIVTHSMGSLVARSYVQSDSYAANVDNLIMIAPPNRGSSDTYAAWEGGRIPNNWESKFAIKAYLSYLTVVTSGTSNYYDTIHNFIPSLKELMPTYDYLHSSGNSENLKDYLSMHEQNNFLQDLSSGAEKLNDRTRFSIILGDSQPTVNKIPVVDSDTDGIWFDGKPDPIDPQKNDTSGDGEVLISSGDIVSDFRDVLDYGHREIVSKSEKIVAERLNESLDAIYDSPEINDEIIFWTDAPADFQITDPDGKKVSKDEKEIENSKYAEEKNKDGFKIASVPNPKKGNYQIKLNGNDKGKYHLGVEYTSLDGKNSDQSKTSEVEIKPNETDEFIVVSDPQDSVAPIEDIAPKDIIAPNISISSPVDKKEYSTTDKITIEYVVSDNISEVKNIQVRIYYDDNEISADLTDLSKEELGKHTLEINAIDEAENLASAKVEFAIIDVNSDEENPDFPEDTIDALPTEPSTPPDQILPVGDVKNPNETNTNTGTETNVDATAANQSVIETSPNKSEKKHHKKKKHKKKSHKKSNPLAKTVIAGGVKKYTGEIKTESSTVNLPAEPLSVEDVFGTPSSAMVLGESYPPEKNADFSKTKQFSSNENFGRYDFEKMPSFGSNFMAKPFVMRASWNLNSKTPDSIFDSVMIFRWNFFRKLPLSKIVWFRYNG